MRIGIDAHILSPNHHRSHPEIAEYTRNLLRSLLQSDTRNTYVLFMDSRMSRADLAEFTRPNTEIRHFPFTQYRSYLPFFYAHMLVSSILNSAQLDVFHSPEGLIPYLYPGKIVATFHWVPTGSRDANVFVKTWMMGARSGFSEFCRKASRIVLLESKDRDILCNIHKYPEERAVTLPDPESTKETWTGHAGEMLRIYREVSGGIPQSEKKYRVGSISDMTRAWRTAEMS